MTENLVTNIHTAQFWDNCYDEGDTRWDMSQVSPSLKHYIDTVLINGDKDINILLAGAGNAYEAVYLHKLGFTNVFVVDFASTPIENFASNCPDFPKDKLLVADFFALGEAPYNMAYSFDLALEQTFFCAIPVVLREQYVEQMHKLLKPKAKLVGLLWGCQFPHNESLENLDKPPFGGDAEEYQGLFSEKFTINKMENCYNSHPARNGTELFIDFETLA